MTLLGRGYTKNPNHKTIRGFFINQNIPKENLCIKNYVFPTKLPEAEKMPAEFISCAFNTNGIRARFFLTNDPYFSESAFLAAPSWKEPSSNHTIHDEIKYFELRDRFTNISTLKRFDNS